MKKLLPVLAGLAALGAHIAWSVRVPDGPYRAWGVVAPPLGERLGTYLSGGAAWLGGSYALSAAFTVYALFVFRESRTKAVAGTVGGLAIMGALYGLGCFALGCCGSPMLPLYLAFFGGKWFGMSGPVMFALTVVSIGAGILVLRRNRGCACVGPACSAQPDAPGGERRRT